MMPDSLRASLRLQLLVIVTLSGVAAFVTSVIALRLELASMMLRYPLAAACGYLAFLLLIRAWIAMQRRGDARPGRRSGLTEDLASSIDVPDIRLPSRAAPDVSLFAGGRSGGGGAGVQWADAAHDPLEPAPRGSSGAGVGLDFDELWPVVLAAACALAGVVAIAYVIYAAPLLLGEIALDAAIVSGLYRRLRKKEPSHWAVTTVRHTWLPAMVLVLFAAIGGFALERIAPDARSIGGVVRAISE
jgi:hypothetical protein